MSKESYPKLEQFLGAYFHQDWSLDDPDSASVLASYLKKASAKSVQSLLSELEALRARKLKDPSLKKTLEGLGCCFEPASEKKTHTQWVNWLVRTLKAGKSA